MTREQRIEQARAMRAGGMTYDEIGRELGVTHSCVWRWLRETEEVRERRRASSRRAKRRRTGTCEECGGVTRYHGHVAGGVSRLCSVCGPRRGSLAAAARRGTGPTQARIVAFVEERGEVRFSEVAALLGSKGNAAALLHRLVGYGILERPSRGRYRRAAP